MLPSSRWCDYGGFGPETIIERPSTTAIDSALRKVGYANIKSRRQPPALKKTRPELELDLSAIAKGYAVDALSVYLDTLFVANYLVEIGGEIRAKGHNADKKPWQVGIQQPQVDEKQAALIVALQDQAIATSGDYRNYFIDAGKRYSHIIDPRNGYPVTHQTASVTVLADTAAAADAWATTLLVLGEQDGLQLAEQQGVAALFLVREADGFTVNKTALFEHQAR